MQVKIGRIYAWDPSRTGSPEDVQALVAMSKDPFELLDIDTAAPRLRKAPDWSSSRYGMLGVELYGRMLSRYEKAVLDAGDWYVLRDIATAFGELALQNLEDLAHYHPGEREVVHRPDEEGLRLVTFRSIELVRSYSGWLWGGRS